MRRTQLLLIDTSVWFQVQKLLSICYVLVESWELPSRSLSGSSAPRNQISPKLAELKTGILLLIRVSTCTNLPHMTFGFDVNCATT